MAFNTRILVVSACLSLISLGTAGAEPIRYVVGVEELDYYPAYAVKNGQYAGAAREILDAFAQDQGFQFHYQPLPIVRLTGELVSGGIDFKFPDSPNWQTELRKGKTIAYSKAVIAYIDGVMVKPENRGRGLAKFTTLGTVSGFTPHGWLAALKEGRVKLVENPQMRALQRQVIAGRIDGAYASVAVANHLLETDLALPGALVFDETLPHTRGDYLLSSARHPELIKRFDAWLTANGDRITQIKNKYSAEKGVR